MLNKILKFWELWGSAPYDIWTFTVGHQTFRSFKSGQWINFCLLVKHRSCVCSPIMSMVFLVLWDSDYNKRDRLKTSILDQQWKSFFTSPHVPSYFLFWASLSAGGHKNDTEKSARLKMYRCYVSALAIAADWNPQWAGNARFPGGRHVEEKRWENTRLSADVTLDVTLALLEPCLRVTRTFPPAALLE